MPRMDPTDTTLLLEPADAVADADDLVMQGLRDTFGLDHFRPMQREVVEDVLASRDVLCVMPTGAGKSLCYQLPATVSGGLTLVVSPLISLMENQVGQLRDAGIACHMLNSSMPPDEVRRRWQRSRPASKVCSTSRPSGSPTSASGG